MDIRFVVESRSKLEDVGLADGNIARQLFSSNFALPMIGYIYVWKLSELPFFVRWCYYSHTDSQISQWNQDTKSDHETGINSVTLCGCIVGQLLLGVLADHWGRKRLYGWELVILVASSLGVAMSSAGRTVTETVDGVVVTESSMRISAWLMFVRFIAGVGIGVCQSSLLASEDSC
jgi:MFS transporter, PHS family, inorganic phosphate transporter